MPGTAAHQWQYPRTGSLVPLTHDHPTPRTQHQHILYRTVTVSAVLPYGQKLWTTVLSVDKNGEISSITSTRLSVTKSFTEKKNAAKNSC